MSDVFRIIDRFSITGRESIYTIKTSKGSVLRGNDILLDLHGNKFRVMGTEMGRRLISDIYLEDLPVGIIFELISGTDVQGNILVRNLTDVNYLFCNHPLYPRRVDEDYEAEYQAAGLDHSCALISYEDFEDGELSLYGEDISGLTIYRGWMLKPEKYRDLYERLEKRNIILINTPEEYERYHMLPGWYEDFKDETPNSVWVEVGNLNDVMNVARYLEGSCVVKDYVKSRKHEWYDACFIKNIRDKRTAEKTIRNFIERQGSNLVGGIVLRKFEKLKKIGFHELSGMPLFEEYRVFIFAGRIVAIDNYWQGNIEIKLSDEEYKWVEFIAERVKSNFVTVDLARKEDGSLIIIEFGDGQVSGLQQLRADAFYRVFKGLDIYNPYTIEDVKRIITTYTRLDIKPEMTLIFRDKLSEYMIISYTGHVSFQRCGYEDAGGETDYPDLDTLFSAKLIDGICLERDWYKVTGIWCEPDMDKIDEVIETYRKATEQRNEILDDRYHISKAVKREIDKWNPYGLLPEASQDELNIESESIARKLTYDSTVDFIAKTVSKVFSRAFEPQYFSIDKCMDVATRIKEALDEDRGDD